MDIVLSKVYVPALFIPSFVDDNSAYIIGGGDKKVEVAPDDIVLKVFNRAIIIGAVFELYSVLYGSNPSIDTSGGKVQNYVLVDDMEVESSMVRRQYGGVFRHPLYRHVEYKKNSHEKIKDAKHWSEIKRMICG